MINLMFSGNKKIFHGMVIASISILKHTKEPITTYILTMERTHEDPRWQAISDEQIDYLQNLYSQTNSKSQVIKIDVGDLYEKYLQNTANSKTLYTPYALLRLFADQIDILPDKILYLDTDVMAYSNIKQLYDIDISNYEIACAKDYYGKFFIGRNYCNSGVLLMNMAKIRQTKMLSKALKMCAEKKMLLPDQSAINKVTKQKLILPPRFNEQHKLHDDTVIRHFSATIKFFPIVKKQNIKPWDIDKVHKILKCYEFDDILNDYLARKPELDALLAQTDTQKSPRKKSIKKVEVN